MTKSSGTTSTYCSVKTMALSARLLRPRASGRNFDPRSIPGLGVWMDAADQGTMFDSNSGGSVITNNVGVGRWMDKSGNGQNATQSISGNRPVYKLNQIGGLPTLDFDGSDDSLEVPDSAFLKTTNGLSLFVVAILRTSANNNRGLIAKWNSAGGSGNEEWLFTSRAFASPNRQAFFVQNAAGTVTFTSGQTTNQYADGVARVYSGIHDPNGSISVRVSGALENSGASGVSKTDGVAAMTIGRYATTPSGAVNIGEVLIYNVPLSLAAISAVERYLRYKWSLP
jgi:hypothetical protein